MQRSAPAGAKYDPIEERSHQAAQVCNLSEFPK